jgi:thiol-disulfide isomerase/thioredoxin
MRRHPAPRRLAATAFLLAAFALLGAVEAAAQSGVSLALGTAAPDVTLEDLDGNQVRLMDVVAGRPALIEFWASWCEQCEALQPTVDEVQARFGDRVQIVAVAVAVAQSQRRVRRHVEEHGADYPYLWDAKGEAVRAYQAAATSIVVLLDAEGQVAYTGVGPSQDLVAEVAALLDGQTP